MNEKEQMISEIYERIFNLEKYLNKDSEKERYILDLIYHLLFDLKIEMKKEDLNVSCETRKEGD